MAEKLYAVTTYVKANSASDAIKKAKGLKPDEVYVDSKWRDAYLPDVMGFKYDKK